MELQQMSMNNKVLFHLTLKILILQCRIEFRFYTKCYNNHNFSLHAQEHVVTAKT